MKSLFVPSEEKIQALIDTVKSKFDFVETIKISASSLIDIIKGIGQVPKITINIPSTKYTPKFSTDIDFSWFESYKNYTDIIITGFVYIAFLWRLFITLPSTINGSGGIINPPSIKLGDMDLKITDVSNKDIRRFL